MINYLVGDIFQSPAECIVNTVNCEGFQGKGIAYQFKKRYPENEKAYKTACENHTLTIGNILVYRENDKYIANFPTKKEWRKKSEYNYITAGMEDLVRQIRAMEIRSIAIPPLGCGNGGLEWTKVKSIIENHIRLIENNTEVYIYEPSHSCGASNKLLPRMNVNHLLLLGIKNNMRQYNRARLFSAVFYFTLYSQYKKFGFTVDPDTGFPQSSIVDSLSRDIKYYQEHYGIASDEAEKLLAGSLVSRQVELTVKKYNQFILSSANLIDSLNNEPEIQYTNTVLDKIAMAGCVSFDEIPNIKLQLCDTANNLDHILNLLVKSNLIEQTLEGYSLKKNGKSRNPLRTTGL